MSFTNDLGNMSVSPPSWVDPVSGSLAGPAPWTPAQQQSTAVATILFNMAVLGSVVTGFLLLKVLYSEAPRVWPQPLVLVSQCCGNFLLLLSVLLSTLTLTLDLQWVGLVIGRASLFLVTCDLVQSWLTLVMLTLHTEWDMEERRNPVSHPPASRAGVEELSQGDGPVRKRNRQCTVYQPCGRPNCPSSRVPVSASPQLNPDSNLEGEMTVPCIPTLNSGQKQVIKMWMGVCWSLSLLTGLALLLTSPSTDNVCLTLDPFQTRYLLPAPLTSASSPLPIDWPNMCFVSGLAAIYAGCIGVMAFAAIHRKQKCSHQPQPCQQNAERPDNLPERLRISPQRLTFSNRFKQRNRKNVRFSSNGGKQSYDTNLSTSKREFNTSEQSSCQKEAHETDRSTSQEGTVNKQLSSKDNSSCGSQENTWPMSADDRDAASLDFIDGDNDAGSKENERTPDSSDSTNSTVDNQAVGLDSSLDFSLFDTDEYVIHFNDLELDKAAFLSFHGAKKQDEHLTGSWHAAEPKPKWNALSKLSQPRTEASGVTKAHEEDRQNKQCEDSCMGDFRRHAPQNIESVSHAPSTTKFKRLDNKVNSARDEISSVTSFKVSSSEATKVHLKSKLTVSFSKAKETPPVTRLKAFNSLSAENSAKTRLKTTETGPMAKAPGVARWAGLGKRAAQVTGKHVAGITDVGGAGDSKSTLDSSNNAHNSHQTRRPGNSHPGVDSSNNAHNSDQARSPENDHPGAGESVTQVCGGDTDVNRSSHVEGGRGSASPPESLCVDVDSCSQRDSELSSVCGQRSDSALGCTVQGCNSSLSAGHFSLYPPGYPRHRLNRLLVPGQLGQQDWQPDRGAELTAEGGSSLYPDIVHSKPTQGTQPLVHRKQSHLSCQDNAETVKVKKSINLHSIPDSDEKSGTTHSCKSPGDSKSKDTSCSFARRKPTSSLDCSAAVASSSHQVEDVQARGDSKDSDTAPELAGFKRSSKHTVRFASPVSDHPKSAPKSKLSGSKAKRWRRVVCREVKCFIGAWLHAMLCVPFCVSVAGVVWRGTDCTSRHLGLLITRLLLYSRVVISPLWLLSLIWQSLPFNNYR